MRHSRSISDLRADVAENCRTLLTLAEREGLSVLVTETVRDAAYQRITNYYLYLCSFDKNLTNS